MSLICVDWICPSCGAKNLDAYYKQNEIPDRELCPNCYTPLERYYGNQKFTENRTWGAWKGYDDFGKNDTNKPGNYKKLRDEGALG